MTYRSDTDLCISVSDKTQNGYGPTPVRPDAEPTWSIPISGKEFDNFVVFHNELVIIHREYKEVVAVKAASGEQVWAVEDPAYQRQMKADGFYWPTSVSCANGQILIWNGTFFHILDANNGKVLIDAPDADMTKMPDAHNYRQYGDWSRKHTGDQWVNRLSGESQPTVPEVFSVFQAMGYPRIDGLPEHYFFDDYLASWSGEQRGDGTRTLVCYDTAMGESQWTRDISISDLGVDADDPSRPVNPPKLIFQTRTCIVVTTDRYVTGPSGAFVLIDPENGESIAKGYTGGWLPVELATGRVLDPPPDSRDLVLVHQTEARSFELVHAKDGETEDGWFYCLSAIDMATGEIAWTTRESLGCRYKPEFNNPYRDAGSRILCRTGNTLWVRHTAFNDIRYKTAKPGDYWQGEECKGGEKLPLPKETTVLVAVDHNTGEVLHTRKLSATAEYAGQNDGRLYLREGRKIVCYA